MYLVNALKEALGLIISLDREMIRICLVSITVSSCATFLAGLIGVPLGVIIANNNFWGKRFIVILLNTLQAMPTVVIGLMVYAFISRQGPFGKYGILFTPYAMVIGQSILACPIISALTLSAISALDPQVSRTALTLGASSFQVMWRTMQEGDYLIWAAVIAGFGRVFSEVGISMMLGGNIKNYTRNITTAMAYQTSKGEFSLSLALGIILLTVAFIINIVFQAWRHRQGNVSIREY